VSEGLEERRATRPSQVDLIEAFFARQAFARADALAPLLVRKPIVVDGRTMERETQLFLWIVERARRPTLPELPAPEARRHYAWFAKLADGDPEPMPRQLDRAIDGKGGKIRIRVVWPAHEGGAIPALLYFHGGGFVVGGIETDDAFCRRLARLAGCAVVSVGYRLAPEHRFPAAIEDAEAAYRFLLEEGADLGIDPARIAVGGCSAGGNLAAVLCQLARDASLPAPRHQLLFYPLADAAATTGSRVSCDRGFFLDGATIRWFNEHYLGGPPRKEFRVSPLRRPDLTRLPPATVATAGFDPLRDEGVRYAERLAAAGVPVRHLAAEGSIHGFALLPFLPEGQRIVAEAAASLRAAFEGRPGA
jgi:acetyl esterase